MTNSEPANRRNWDERVPIHRRDTTGFYGVEQFLAGGKRLYLIDEPLVFDEAQTYTGDPTPLTASRTYRWIHSRPRILCALTATGLVLDFVHELAKPSW